MTSYAMFGLNLDFWISDLDMSWINMRGVLRKFDEAIAWFVDGNLNCWACIQH